MDERATTLLTHSEKGVGEATSELLPLIYDELHLLAERHLHKERADHTLTPTALINEAYLKLMDQTSLTIKDRQHFFALSSRIMRQILVDYARRRNADKRGGGERNVSIDDVSVADPEGLDQIIAVDEALIHLKEYNESLAELVQLRFFGGFSMAEASAILNQSKRSTERMWTRARAFLLDYMEREKNQ